MRNIKVLRKFIVVFFIVLIFSLFLNFYFLFKQYGGFLIKKSDLIKVIVTKVIDGDTFDTKDGERVRLYEIDAPELPTGCLSEVSKFRLEEQILNNQLTIIRTGKDNFGRTLAYVFKKDLLINKSLVIEGLAYFQKGKTMTEYSLTIEQAQSEAKEASRGIWSSQCETKKDGCLIKGNYRPADNTRIYHTPDCYNYDKIIISPGTTDTWFCTEVEATAAGFIKSKDCPK